MVKGEFLIPAPPAFQFADPFFSSSALLRGEQKRQVSERYWIAICREIASSCKCTAFRKRNNTIELLPCLCSRLTSNDLARLSSRIPILIYELRSMIFALLPSPSRNASTLQSYQISIATGIVAAALDPTTVSQQIASKTFNPSALANCLGGTMKLHCAPIRDIGVDQMMKLFESNQIGNGLRKALEILELMKLVRSPSVPSFSHLILISNNSTTIGCRQSSIT
jgi:hypothetical protein